MVPRKKTNDSVGRTGILQHVEQLPDELQGYLPFDPGVEMILGHPESLVQYFDVFGHKRHADGIEIENLVTFGLSFHKRFQM